MANKTAKKGQIFVCAACGKKSYDRYGEKSIDQGWDGSCMMHSVLCDAEPNEDGTYNAIQESDQ